MVQLDALGPIGGYRTRAHEVIADVMGVPVAELSIVPALYVHRSIQAQRTVRPLSAAHRGVALAEAAEIFATAEIGGLGFEQYVGMVSRVSGLPIAVARSSARGVAAAVRGAVEAAAPARPVGAALDWRDEPTRRGSAVWSRRGEVLAVHASGNSPGVHGAWIQALALGYRVAIRPSRREPFTGHRLVNALRHAGFRPEDALYLPTDHAGAAEIISAADLAVVYGGQGIVDKYAADPTVMVNGPGRTKILITAEQDWRDYLDVIVESISGQGGMACTNTTAVLYEGDPRPLAQAIAARLATIAPLPAADERATLPTQPLDAAKRVADHLAVKAHCATALLGADQVVADLGDGSAALRPAVHLLARPDVDTLNTELAFPCAWISPWSRADGIAPLRHSLVINAITSDGELIDALLDEPTVANVYSGQHLTSYAAPEIPHDGFLADFLMRTKGVIRD
ncbi:aldehyde dehydrogenase family protein [Mycobacterium sp. CBMA271]|uniref:aldehyde dehydrogenase family protein n=1 Tax=unclassified Mycobacteroides TaxID=2618759 RepID=UPI0013285342|nr:MULTISPECIES: aldehyde dehydrogenase family protein [unclassified Mycobacteroides]MUM18519.1 aldehyde dehydrogenase [Mycobacteroides sp. CBMA 326]MUM23788.1 aldehyde dehydrogenase family protein [Mycobacteroides sp. CBMA 271]